MNDFNDKEKANLITEIVCDYCNAPKDVFTRKTRKSNYVKVKHYACYLIKKNTNLSSQKICDKFNFKNHSSIILLIKKINDLMKFDREMREEIEALQNILKFKGLLIQEKVNLNEFYYIDMNNFVSVKEKDDKAVIFVGYSDKEIIDLIGLKKLVKHNDTKKFILENYEKAKGENGGQ